MKAIYVSRQQPRVSRPSPHQLELRPIAEAMSSPVACVRADTPLADALQAMVRGDRRHLVVIDGDGQFLGAARLMHSTGDDAVVYDNGVPVGIVTGSDLIGLMGG